MGVSERTKSGSGGDRFLYHAARLVLSGIFLYACYDKILHPQDFARAVFNYQILPEFLVPVTALVLPWLELALGVCLITNRWMAGAVAWANLLLLAFLGALVFNLLRGLDMDCGCFGSGGEPAGWLTVLRDLSFLFVSGYLLVWLFSHSTRPATGGA